MERAWVVLLALQAAVGAEAAEPPNADGGATAATVLSPMQGRPLDKAEDAVVHVSEGLRGALPASVRVPAWLGLELWQWVGLPVVLLAAFALSLVLSALSVRLLQKLFSTPAGDAAPVLGDVSGPIRLFWFGLWGALGLHFLALPEGALTWGGRLFRALLGLGFFWALVRVVRAWSAQYLASQRAQTNPGSRALVGLVARIAQLAMVAFASLLVLAELGFSVTNVLAGLGIGGIALALGAQKTLEHLFGAFALALDQPFREGDFVKVEDVTGTVETIGLRSTRIRTLERTVVTIPNGKLADMRLETFAARDRFLLQTTLTLTYGTTAGQLRAVRDGIEEVLRAHPKIWADTVSVRFSALATSSLNVEVLCWFLVKDIEEFKAVREAVLLDFMAVVERHGASFAFPTQTVHLVQPPAGGPKQS